MFPWNKGKVKLPSGQEDSSDPHLNFSLVFVGFFLAGGVATLQYVGSLVPTGRNQTAAAVETQSPEPLDQLPGSP